MDWWRTRGNTLVKIKLYVEGGGDSKSQHVNCREGFRKLLENAGFKGKMPRIVACGGRRTVYDKFITSVNSNESDYNPMMLIDSETRVTNHNLWEFLKESEGWDKPDNSDDSQVQLMAQCMETWCVVDRETLRSFFGQCLNEASLPPLNNLESRDKKEILQALENATCQCEKDRKYKKGKRSFKLLGELNTDVLMNELYYFKRLCETLEEKL